MSVLRVDTITWLNNLFVLIQVCAIVSLVVCLLVQAPTLNSTSFVFFDYYNSSGFSSKAYVMAVSIMSACYAFVGYDFSAHLAEEVHDARISAPHSILNTVFASIVTSLVVIFALLYSMQDISTAVSGNAT